MGRIVTEKRNGARKARTEVDEEDGYKEDYQADSAGGSQ